VDKVMCFISPKIVGEKMLHSVEGIGALRMCEAIGVKNISVVKFGKTYFWKDI